MIYTINQLRDKVCENVYAVYDIFKNYFGEEYVDLQNLPSSSQVMPSGVFESALPNTDISDEMILDIRHSNRNYPFILVYWPRVTVTNEYNRSVDIQDLYAKITLTMDGTIPYEYTFQLNRSRYSMEQFVSFGGSGYLHSHIPRIPKEDFTQFLNPCLGTGPIKETIGTLKNGFDEVTWMLFCRELSMYVTVESLTGGPYRRLESIGMTEPLSNYNRGFNIQEDCVLLDSIRTFRTFLGKDTLKEFVLYYLRNGHLSLVYKQGQYYCGMPYTDFIIDISNAFISFYNEYLRTDAQGITLLYDNRILYDALIIDNKFYSANQPRSQGSVAGYIGSYVCTFKGQRIHLVIDEPETSEATSSVIINHNLAMYILSRVLRVINYRYQNEHNRQSGAGFEYETTAPTYQKVRYL